MLNPFYIVLVFVFIRYEVGLCNPFIYFCYCFIGYDVGMLNPLYIFLVLGFIFYQVGM